MSDPIAVIQDKVNIRSRAAALAADPGSIAIENIAGSLKQVDDQGTATALGGAGSGTVTSVAATASGLLAVAGTPTVAPTVGIAAMAANTIIANATAGSAVPTAASAAAVKTLLAIAAGDVSGLSALATSASGAGISAGTVANAALANMAANTVKGSVAGGVPADLTATQLAGITNLITGAPKQGANLTDADVTITPGTDKVSLMVLPAGTLTANRAVTISNAGAVVNQYFIIRRRDRTANTLTINNATPTTMYISGASPTVDVDYAVYFNGAAWGVWAFQYIEGP